MRADFGALGAAMVLLATLSAAEIPAVETAHKEVDRIQSLVAAGAASHSRLESAEAALDDARDDAVLGATLFGRVSAQDLSDEQSRNMLDAAERRVDRQKRRLERARSLVAAGVAAPASLEPELAELDLRQKTLALAGMRARLFAEIVEQARMEESASIAMADTPAADSGRAAVRFDGNGVFEMAGLKSISDAFLGKFARALPVSASGETAIHKALGFDHRGRVDVALNPDQPEGRWLRAYLEQHHIPYFAFRRAVPGKATAAHIHIGLPSPRLQTAD